MIQPRIYWNCSHKGLSKQAATPQGLKPRFYCPLAARLNRLLKNPFWQEKATSGAKAPPILEDLAARLKSCPSQNLFVAEFFRSL